jgi:photosystem II stability/assembly factor-like uncharacterized protein
MKPSLLTLPLIAVGLSLSLVASCTSVTSTPVGTAPTATAQPPAETPTATTGSLATNTPQPAIREVTPTPAPSEAPAAQPLVVASVDMVTASEGWSTGSIAAQSGGSGPSRSGNVYRTTDGGMHWQDVTPSGVMSDTVTSVYFLDKSRAWVAAVAPTPAATNAGSMTITIYRTTDGGQTWDHGAPISVSSGGGPGSLEFVDAQHGWLMISLSAGMMHEAVAIFSTTDGGMQWQQVSLTSGQQGQSTQNSLPFVCDKSGIGFTDAVLGHEPTGWAAGACPGGRLFFYVTHDGGRTWQPQTLPTPLGYPADLYSQCQCAVSRPTFITPEVGFVTIQIYEQQPSAVLYITEDGGATWAPRNLPVQPLPGGGPEFIDAMTGWLTGGQQLYATHDTGQSWSPVGALPVPGGDLRSLDFADANNGWLLGQKLYVTHDGGASWSGMTPMVTAGGGSTSPVVSLKNDGTVIQLQPGERFLLKLGEDNDWTVTVTDQSIVSRVAGILVVRGAQGVYEAHAAGSTTLTATGDPVCRQAQPPCASPTREFRLDIIVSLTPTPSGQTTYVDPFAYCTTIGTVDAPDSRYTGPKVPESVARGLQAALNVPDTPLDVLANGSFWRCIDGEVYACFVGANLPCDSKANTDRMPTQAEKDFCQQQPDADAIPAYVTGHDTIYEWRCTNGAPKIVKQVFQVDARGFIGDIWYEIEPDKR